MILDYFNPELSPERWEELIDSAFGIKYTTRHHKVPSAYRGDCGIEGFVDDGIVYQCYYPDQKYDNDKLYEYQRDKLTKDLAKITAPNNVRNLVSVLGQVVIKEWYLVVPEYKDRRIVEHANNKQTELRQMLTENPMSHIDPNIRVTVQQANNFQVEIAQTIRVRNQKIKLSIESVSDSIDYSACEQDKVDNIKRKLKAIAPNIMESELNGVVSLYIKYYLEGVELINNLRVTMPTEHKELNGLILTYKNDAELKTLLNDDSTSNRSLFNEITKEFESNLATLAIFNTESISILKNSIIAAWLADCSMEFKNEKYFRRNQ